MALSWNYTEHGMVLQSANESQLTRTHLTEQDILPEDYEDLGIDDIEESIRATFYMYSHPSVAVLIALYCLCFMIGFVGNLLVVFIFTRSRHMRTVTNSFLVNLACCDLMVIFFCYPFQ